MNRAEAKRLACRIVASQIDASMGDMIDQSGHTLSEQDYLRVHQAMHDLVRDLRYRGTEPYRRTDRL